MPLDLIGKQLAGYQVLAELGRGGMGIVYRARELNLDRYVALKVLPQNPLDEPEALARFQREARAAAGLNHPHIITIHAISLEGELPYIAMECVEGPELARLIESRGKLAVEEALEIGAQVASALGEAHRSGIVHRDIKPQNILVAPGPRAKVVDFGIARLAESRAGGITRSSSIIGTPAYMAPEHMLGERIDERADLYSLGVVLYQALAGRVPHAGATPAAVIQKALNETPPPIESVVATIPARVGAIIRRAMARDLKERYASAEEMERDLRSALAQFSARPAGGFQAATVRISAGDFKLPPPKRNPLAAAWKSAKRYRSALAAGAALGLLLGAGFAAVWKAGEFEAATEEPHTESAAADAHEDAASAQTEPEIADAASEESDAPAPAEKQIAVIRRAEGAGDTADAEKGSISAGEKNPSPPAKSAAPPGPKAIDETLKLYTGAGGKVDEAAARGAILDAAEKGSPYARAWAAWFQLWGRCGFARDRAEAERLAKGQLGRLKAMAEESHAGAIFLRGAFLDQGLGGEADPARAAQWIATAAEAGCTPAMNYLGWMLMEGRGGEKNPVRAAEWFAKSAEAGDTAAMHNLGWLLVKGEGAARDAEAGARWFKRGAEAGSPRCMSNLAWAYGEGAGVERSGEKTVEWLRRAAEAGDDMAMVNLAARLETGQGVERDLAAARTLLEKSAKQGNEEARKKLAGLAETP